ALMWAAAEGNADAVKLLIGAGADFHARLISGFSPFLLAVREGQSDVVQVLLEAGVDVNETFQPQQGGPKRGYSKGAPPKAGTSALALAVLNCHFQLAADLLDAGA